MACATIASMRVSSSAVGGRLARPITSLRTSVAGMSVPRLMAMPRVVSRVKYSSNDVQSTDRPARVSASGLAVFADQNAGESPSPMISLVMPWRR